MANMLLFHALNDKVRLLSKACVYTKQHAQYKYTFLRQMDDLLTCVAEVVSEHSSPETVKVLSNIVLTVFNNLLKHKKEVNFLWSTILFTKNQVRTQLRNFMRAKMIHYHSIHESAVMNIKVAYANHPNRMKANIKSLMDNLRVVTKAEVLFSKMYLLSIQLNLKVENLINQYDIPAPLIQHNF